MGLARFICRFFGMSLALYTLVIILTLSSNAFDRAFILFVERHVPGGVFLDACTTIYAIRGLVEYGTIAMDPTTELYAKRLATTGGYTQGATGIYRVAQPTPLRAVLSATDDAVRPKRCPVYSAIDGVTLYRASHAAAKAVHYDPQLKRPRDCLLAANTTKYPGYFPPDVFPVLQQLDTDDPRRLARRQLLADTVPALARHPSWHPAVVAFKPPPGVAPADFAATKRVCDAVAFTLFRQARVSRHLS